MNNTGSLINHGERYRSKFPISTSRAEGCVDEIANAWMTKKQRMRWSSQGARRMSTVRAAVLDGRLKVTVDITVAALQTSFFPLPYLREILPNSRRVYELRETNSNQKPSVYVSVRPSPCSGIDVNRR